MLYESHLSACDDVRASLQSVLVHLKRFDEAYSLLSNAMTLRVSIFGDEHPGTDSIIVITIW